MMSTIDVVMCQAENYWLMTKKFVCFNALKFCKHLFPQFTEKLCEKANV